MLLRILHFAMFVLLIWLTFQFSLLRQQVTALQTLNSSQQQALDKTLLNTRKNNSKQLETLSTQISSIVKARASNDNNQKQLKAFKTAQNKLDTLRQAYILVLEAEAARVAQDSETAQERLNASKKLIWKSGRHYPKQKKSLQGLMKTIDITLGAWKRQDLSRNTHPIYSVVAQAIKQQTAKPTAGK